MGFQNQPAYVVNLWINHRIGQDIGEREVSQRALGGHPLPFGARRDASQLVAGLLLVGLGQQLAQISEMEALVHVPCFIINQIEAFRRRERTREPPAEILSGSERSPDGTVCTNLHPACVMTGVIKSTSQTPCAECAT